MEPSEAEKLLQQASAAMRSNQYPNAAAFVDKVLAALPEDPAARHLRGTIHLSLNETALAIPHLRAAVAAGIDTPGVGVPALAALGTALLKTRDRAEGMRLLTEAAELKPGNYLIAWTLGQAYAEQRDGRNAETWLRRATKAGPNVDRTHLALGRLMFDMRRYDAARSCFEHVLGLQPGNAAATYNLSLVNQRQGRYQEAADGFAKCRKPIGPTRALMLAWGQCLQELDKMDEALGVYRDLLAHDADAYSAVLRALTTTSKGLFDSSAAALKAMLTAKPN